MKHWIDELEKVENDGCSTWIRKDNFIDLQCIRESITEDQYRLKSLVGKVDFVIDIGACQGVFARRAIQILKCPVFSFEPHPDNFNILTLNAQNSSPRIHLFQGAFVPKGSNKKVFLTTNAHEAANHLAEDGIAILGWDYIDILNLIPKGKRVLLKMDFEGGEDRAILDLTPFEYKSLHIAGEWHHNPDPVRQALIETKCDNIEVYGVSEDITGLFFATKGV